MATVRCEKSVFKLSLRSYFGVKNYSPVKPSVLGHHNYNVALYVNMSFPITRVEVSPEGKCVGGEKRVLFKS